MAMKSKKTPMKKNLQTMKETEKSPTMEEPLLKTEETPTEDTTTTTDESLPKRYYVQFWKKVQPAEPRFDTLAGTIYWSDVKQDIIIEGLNNVFSSDIEAMFGNDLKLPHGVFVSYAETPKEWVRNLHLAERANNFYAVQFMEMIDETE